MENWPLAALYDQCERDHYRGNVVSAQLPQGLAATRRAHPYFGFNPTPSSKHISAIVLRKPLKSVVAAALAASRAGDGSGRPSSVMSLGVASVGGHSHGHPASPIGVGSLWEDIVPRSLGCQRQLDSIHNTGLRLALGAFCTSPVSSLYAETNEALLEERRLKLSMNYYLKTRACIENRAHHALHEFDQTTRDLYAPKPNGRGGMSRPPTRPVGLRVEAAVASAEINVFAPWGNQASHQEHTNMTRQDTTSWKE